MPRPGPARPALARLAHIRAVLAVRLSLEDSDAYQDGRTWWRSERRIRAAAGGRVGTGRVPDAEVSWPDLPASTYAGECWAIEAELTPKPLTRTTAIMRGLLTRTADYQPGARPGDRPRCQRVVPRTPQSWRPEFVQYDGLSCHEPNTRVLRRDHENQDQDQTRGLITCGPPRRRLRCR
jgi:hypothetical protein